MRQGRKAWTSTIDKANASSPVTAVRRAPETAKQGEQIYSAQQAYPRHLVVTIEEAAAVDPIGRSKWLVAQDPLNSWQEEGKGLARSRLGVGKHAKYFPSMDDAVGEHAAGGDWRGSSLTLFGFAL